MTKKIVDYAKGGHGKKAPYQTEMYRIPTSIKREVQLIAAIVRRLYANAGEAGVKEFLLDLTNATLEVDAKTKGYSTSDNPVLVDSQLDDSFGTPGEILDAVKAVVQAYRRRRKDTRNWVEANRLIDDLDNTFS